MLSVILYGVWRKWHGTLFGLGVVRIRYVIVMSWVCLCKIDRASERMIVWLVLGRVIVSWECRLCFVDRAGSVVLWMRVVVESLLST